MLDILVGRNANSEHKTLLALRPPFQQVRIGECRWDCHEFSPQLSALAMYFPVDHHGLQSSPSQVDPCSYGKAMLRACQGSEKIVFLPRMIVGNCIGRGAMSKVVVRPYSGVHADAC